MRNLKSMLFLFAVLPGVSTIAQAQFYGTCGDGINVCTSTYIPVSIYAPVPGYCLAYNETGIARDGSLTFTFGKVDTAYLANPDRDLSATRTLVSAAPAECPTNRFLPLIETIQFVAPELMLNYSPEYKGPRWGDGYGPFVKVKFVGAPNVIQGRLQGVSGSPTIASALAESKTTGDPVSILD